MASEEIKELTGIFTDLVNRLEKNIEKRSFLLEVKQDERYHENKEDFKMLRVDIGRLYDRLNSIPIGAMKVQISSLEEKLETEINNLEKRCNHLTYLCWGVIFGGIVLGIWISQVIGR